MITPKNDELLFINKSTVLMFCLLFFKEWMVFVDMKFSFFDV